MRAVVFLGQKDIEVQQCPDPVPGEGEVLVEVEACGICGSDLHAYKTGMYAPGLIIGHEFSGMVKAVGLGVTRFKPGDKVTANSGLGCGQCFLCRSGKENLCEKSFRLGVTEDGAMAEMVKVPEASLYHIPDSLPVKEACLTEPFSIALHGLDQSQFRPGDRVVIIGAGSIGLCLLQVLKLAGAGAVWVTEPNAFRADIARQFGADLVLNPQKTNPFSVLSDLTSGMMPDIVFECVGLPETVAQAPGLVRRGGQVVILGICDQAVEMDFLNVISNELDIQTAYYSRASDFEKAIHFMAKGSLRAGPLITSQVPLERVKESFESLLSPDSSHVKIVVCPNL